MIDTLDALPALTASWIAPLAQADPELHAELAGTLVVTAPGAAPGRDLPAGVGAVLAAVDLTDKEIGAFRFAPLLGDDADEDAPSARIAGFDGGIRAQLDAPDDLVFIGGYGPGSLFAAPQGIGLFDMEQDRIVILASDFTGFLIA